MKKIISAILSLASFAFAEAPLTLSDPYDASWRICVKGPISVYDLVIFEFRDNSTSTYTGTISDYRGFSVSNVMSLSDVVTDEKGLLRSCTGTFSPTTLNAQDQYALYMIVMGLDMTDAKIMNLQMTSAATFVLTTDENGEGTMKWTASAEYDYALGDVVDEDLTNEVDRVDQVLYVQFTGASSPVVPEPATCTLGLMSLCGLAMRRRR